MTLDQKPGALQDDLEDAQKKHIMQKEHLWEKAVGDGDPNDPDWWEKIKILIAQALEKGRIVNEYLNNKGQTIFFKELDFGRFVVTVKYLIIEGILHISDAWVNK